MSDQPALLGGEPVFSGRLHLVRPWLPDYEDIADDVATIMQTGMVTKGQFLRRFEERVAAHLGVRHAVAVSSCTSGLMLTYKALGLSGEAIAPSFTWMATVGALVWNGLRPVFVDVDPATTNLDPSRVEAAITPRTSAIVAVHNFGAPADVKTLTALARRHGLRLIFDAAHGFGAQHQGQPVGGFGDAEVFSLSPTKLLIAGEGGVVSTNDDDLAERLRQGREYGVDASRDSLFAGINARMPEASAVLGLHSLDMLETAAQNRNRYAHRLREGLGALPGLGFQRIREGDRSAYKDFSITVDEAAFGLNRDQLQAALDAEGIETRLYYQPPVHQQTAYHQYADNAALPNTEALAATSLSLPIYSRMSDDEVSGIIRAIRRVHHHAAAVRHHLESLSDSGLKPTV